MIRIEESPTNAMIDDALKTYPDECCGFMLGIQNQNESTVTEIRVINNSKQGDRRRRFEISPLDYMYAERYADENNLALLGVYHSHPDHPSRPSETDRLAAQPNFSYLIISIIDGKFNTQQSWRLNDEHQFEEETIITN